jgi:predicted short-subunit dehydrogenase-like oxidoreductase (DUF2520 family)
MCNLIHKIGFIGSGNVATHLAIALNAAGADIVEVCSNNIDNAQKLAAKVGAKALVNCTELSIDLDLVLIAVTDSALSQINLKSIGKDTIVCHTSGSNAMSVVNKANHYGVFYPLQTFSSQRDINWQEVPICIEAYYDIDRLRLKALATKLSKTVVEINSAQRKKLHLAAVFACNFSNAMYSIAEQILQEDQLDFDLIRPLIAETAQKAQEHLPKEMQTGPAVRNDKLIIEQHLKELELHPKYQELYKRISEIILIKRKTDEEL